jgi:CRISPR-associated endonuclease/helicase Cas3
MNRAEEKSQRLLQIERLLWAHPEGLTQSEVAKRLGVNRSTIWKYLDKDHMPPGVYIDDENGNKLKMDRDAALTRTAFSLHEVMAIHLATRLLATRTDKQNPHAASALRKLGLALQRIDENVSQHLLCSADVMDEATAYRDPVYLDVLQKLTEAWSAGRWLRVSHQKEDGRVQEYDFAPYFIEPYAIGQTTHVIGLREPPGKVRTFKIERLRSARLLNERYAIPDDFDAGELLRSAWGIWFTEAEPVEIVLKFHPRVARRVQETRWHRSEQTAPQPDGSLLWRAWVAEPQEMLPWVRGWGADCEVVEPVELRERVAGEAKAMAEGYGWEVLPQRGGGVLYQGRFLGIGVSVCEESQ